MKDSGLSPSGRERVDRFRVKTSHWYAIRCRPRSTPFPRSSYRRRSATRPGFTVSGAPIGTFLRSALLIAGQKALGRRFANHGFFETVERDLALGVMRSHFHHEYPKGTHCCVRCTLAVYPVLEVGAIRYFDCAPLAEQVRVLSGSVSGDSPDR